MLNSKLINLLDVRKNNTIVLGDSVELNDFLNKNKINKLTCVLVKFCSGKGLEIIYQLAKKMPKINFDLYGNVNFDKNFNFNSKPKT